MLDTNGRQNNRKLTNKQCAHCGSEFRPARFSASYCSVPCARVKNGGTNRKDECWWVNHRGYIEGRVFIDGKQRRFKQHRYVMEIHLGRALLPSEDVHHVNGNKADNRLENLEVLSHGAHSSEHNKARVYSRGYRLNISEEERIARSERMSKMRRAAIAKATGV